MSRHLEFPRPVILATDYWLCRCEGFLVDDPRGRLGVVTEVRFHSRHDRPDELVVQGGLLGNRVSVVPVSEVVALVPRQARILTSASHRRPALDRVARLRVHLPTAARWALKARPVRFARREAARDRSCGGVSSGRDLTAKG
jgi:hypothetical protein